MTAQGKISKADQHVSEISKNFMAPGYSLCLFKLSLQVHIWALLNSMLGFHCSVQRVFDQTNLSADSHLPLLVQDHSYRPKMKLCVYQ